ncbi:LOW QUALITY PROTEIN: hypothetical protein IFM46972_09888 [Aspergillus udagawae]|uniref:Uncharacterized protein n=1 Tax=Aspergillus udagawae TaxID=91492 RepID=A0A8H3XMC9_9EURO|nr:LOW QUALITY PROTEIN: hypothetical protein IFM46972_09888 [Aspergillus udagawae]
MFGQSMQHVIQKPDPGAHGDLLSVNWVAWAAFFGGTMPCLAASASFGSSGAAKCSDGSYGGSTPPSRERETWILVSLVTRETVAVRAERGIV